MDALIDSGSEATVIRHSEVCADMGDVDYNDRVGLSGFANLQRQTLGAINVRIEVGNA